MLKKLFPYVLVLVFSTTAGAESIKPEERMQFADGLYGRQLFDMAIKEYGQLLAEDPVCSQRAQDLADRVVDLSEYLVSEGRLERLSEQLGPANLGRVAWDAPNRLIATNQR